MKLSHLASELDTTSIGGKMLIQAAIELIMANKGDQEVDKEILIEIYHAVNSNRKLIEQVIVENPLVFFTSTVNPINDAAKLIQERINSYS